MLRGMTSAIPINGRRGLLATARASAATAYIAGFGALAFSIDNPAPLAALVAALIAIAILEGVWRQVRGWLALGLTLAAFFAVVNPLIYREGLTVLVQGPVVPVLGRMDITLEATVYGLIVGLRVLAVVLACALFHATVDADELLHLFRRLSFRSALAASLTTRLVPMLARDLRRLDDAQRCRPAQRAEDAGPSRLRRLRARAPVVRALFRDALERGMDLAAALEVRGFGTAKPRRREAPPWSVIEIALALCGAALGAVALAVLATGSGGFRTYPTIAAGSALWAATLTALVLTTALAPFGAAALRRRRLRAAAGGAYLRS